MGSQVLVQIVGGLNTTDLHMQRQKAHVVQNRKSITQCRNVLAKVTAKPFKILDDSREHTCAVNGQQITKPAVSHQILLNRASALAPDTPIGVLLLH